MLKEGCGGVGLVTHYQNQGNPVRVIPQLVQGVFIFMRSGELIICADSHPVD